LSDSFNTTFSGTQEGIHVGSGPQTNYFFKSSDSIGKRPRRQPEDELRWLYQRFSDPSNLGEARGILESFQTVFLDGPPGSGRVAAAKMLLWELRNDSEQIHELVLQDKEHTSRIDHDHVGDNDLVWLNLSQTEGPQWHEVHGELSALRATVRERGAHLVVILPGNVNGLEPTLARYRVEIKPPRLDDALSRYLLVEGIPEGRHLPPLRFLEADRRMEDVAKYAELVVRAREEDRQGSFTAWCETAHRVLAGQEPDVATLVADLSEGQQRALLLAAAMLHEAHADVVHQAGALLLELVEHPDDRPILLQAPLDQRLKEIDAELDSAGNVRFLKLNYDAAVRSYFWTHMPELHRPVQDWVERTVASADLTPGERADLVDRFTEQCLNERYRPTLISLVDQWTARPTTVEKMQAATLVLQRGLRDEEQGRFFRKQIYAWSTTNNLSDELAEVIIMACRDEMMAKYPDEALVRLHHVARRERGNRARETLVALVDRAPRLRRQMLNRLTNPRFGPGRWPIDVDLFLDLADPEALTKPGRNSRPLISRSIVRDQLSAGWALVFAQRPHDKWAPQAHRWLGAAVADETHRHALLGVLVEAGTGRTDVLAQLYAMTREQKPWISLSAPLIQKINTAQGARLA
jgi:hypothetical protein